jgi:hypothetical protein
MFEKNSPPDAMKAEFYLLRDLRAGKNLFGGISAREQVQFSPDSEADRRCYQALMNATDCMPRPERWTLIYGDQKKLDYSSRYELMRHPTFNHLREFWPLRIGFKAPQPKYLPHQFYVHPFLHAKVADRFLFTPVVSREWRDAIEEFEGRHTFQRIELEFSDCVADNFFYIFSKNLLYHGVKHLKLESDIWITTENHAEPLLDHVYARRRALRGLHWLATPEGFVASAALASRLNRLILKRDTAWMSFFPITPIDD